jgi:aldehyde:ferredoxin oxidoreductase
MNGWTGQCLRVNLTENEFQAEALSQDLMEKFMGGRGLGVKIRAPYREPSLVRRCADILGLN